MSVLWVNLLRLRPFFIYKLPFLTVTLSSFVWLNPERKLFRLAFAVIARSGRVNSPNPRNQPPAFLPHPSAIAEYPLEEAKPQSTGLILRPGCVGRKCFVWACLLGRNRLTGTCEEKKQRTISPPRKIALSSQRPVTGLRINGSSVLENRPASWRTSNRCCFMLFFRTSLRLAS